MEIYVDKKPKDCTKCQLHYYRYSAPAGEGQYCKVSDMKVLTEGYLSEFIECPLTQLTERQLTIIKEDKYYGNLCR